MQNSCYWQAFAKIRTTETHVAGCIFVLDGDPTPTSNQQVLFLAFGCGVINRQEKNNLKLHFQIYRDTMIFHGVSALSCPVGACPWAQCSNLLLSLSGCSNHTWVMLISGENCGVWPTHFTNQVPRVFRVLRHTPQAIFSLISLLGSRNSVLASSGVRQKSFDSFQRQSSLE